MTRHVLKIVWNRKRANALIVAEIFLSFLVLFGVLTLASMIVSSVRQPLGFEWRGLWNVSVGSNSKDLDANKAIDQIMRALRAMPQVESVAASQTPPYSMSENSGTWTINGKSVEITIDSATDDFASVMRIKLVSGRWFQPSDDAFDYTPIVIDTDLARSVYGSDNPIGKRFGDAPLRDIDTKEKERRVVGVIAPYRKNGELTNFGKPINMMFQRASAVKSESLPDNIIIRLRPGTPGSFEQQLSDDLHKLNPQMNFRIRHMDRMRDFAHRMVLLPIVMLGLTSAFLIAMVVLGLSGVLWQNVTRRTREIGLRRAIGATGPAVQRQIVAEVAVLTTLAVIAGVVVVAQLPVLGVFSVITPAAFVGGLLASLAAIYLLTIACGLYPGWLASRVQPAHALHYE